MSRKNGGTRGKGFLLSSLILPLYLMLGIALFTSCGISQDATDNNTQGNTKINVSVQTKSPNDITRTVSDESVNDINVFIIDNDGFLIGHKYTSGTSAYVDTRIANSCKVCVIANYSSDINNISTYDGLKKMVTSAISSATDISNKTTEIMYGEQSALISNTTNTISVILKHLYSKYVFTINPSDGITITGYQLCHVSNISHLVENGTTGNPSSAYLDFGSVESSSTTSFTTGQYYVYENYPGANKSYIGNVKDRNSTNAPSDASFLKITAKSTSNNNPWTSTYYVYLGGVKETDISDFNIPRDYNFNYTISVTGSGYNDARVAFTAGLMTRTNNSQWNSGGSESGTSFNPNTPVNIGDYYFSDGSWGTLAARASSTVKPIGVIFSNVTTSKDKTLGWTHGYAIALRNASSNCYVWSSYDILVNASTPHTPSGMMANREGYSETRKIYDNYASYNIENIKSTFPATYYALKFKDIVPPPLASSGWFLPSIGQFYDASVNLVGMSKDVSTMTDNGNGWFFGYNSYNPLAGVGEANIDKYLSNAAALNVYVDYFTTSTTDIVWASSQYNDSQCYLWQIEATTGTFCLYHCGRDLSEASRRYFVRPVIAF